MKVKIVKKGGKYKRRFSLEMEDWLTILIVVLVTVIALIQTNL